MCGFLKMGGAEGGGVEITFLFRRRIVLHFLRDRFCKVFFSSLQYTWYNRIDDDAFA